MTVYWNEVKVGVLVLLTIALVFMVVVLVGNLQDYFDDTIPVKIKIDRAIGLDVHAQVTYSGVRIGTVTEIEYNEDLEKAIVHTEIRRDSPVSIDSEAKITSSGMLAPNFVEITGGSPDKRLDDLIRQGELDVEEIYLESTSYTSIADVLSLANDVRSALNKMELVLDDIRKPLQKASGFIDDVSTNVNLLTTELRMTVAENRPELSRLLLQLNGLVEDTSASVKPILAKLEEGIETVPRTINETRQNLNTLLTRANGMVESVSPEIVLTTRELRTTITDLRDKIGRVEQNLSTLLNDADNLLVENREDIARIIDRLERTTINLDQLSSQLAKNPWRVIWKTDEMKSPPKVSPDWDPFDLETNQQ